MARNFQTNQIQSFQRSLNLYGFTKYKRGVRTDHRYHHPMFRRDQPELIAQIIRSTNHGRLQQLHERRLDAEANSVSAVPRPLDQNARDRANSNSSNSSSSDASDFTNSLDFESHHTPKSGKLLVFFSLDKNEKASFNTTLHSKPTMQVNVQSNSIL